MNPLSRRSLLKSGAAVTLGAAVAGLSPLLNYTSVSAATLNSDVDVLNYALTLENLEYAFYRDGLNRFTRQSLGISGGNWAQIYSYFEAIRDHEKAHVDTLRSVISSLGGTPVQPCTYNFGYSNPQGFVQTAMALENTGVMAYTGAAALIKDGGLLTAAATIATVEARHAAYLNLLNNVSPFPAAFDTPKSPDEILAIAGQFIVSC